MADSEIKSIGKLEVTPNTVAIVVKLNDGVMLSREYHRNMKKHLTNELLLTRAAGVPILITENCDLETLELIENSQLLRNEIEGLKRRLRQLEDVSNAICQ